MRSLRSERKLRIKRETLRAIADRQLELVAGGTWYNITEACYQDPTIETDGQSAGSRYCPPRW